MSKRIAKRSASESECKRRHALAPNEEEPIRVDSGEGLGDLDEALKSHDYPAPTDELVEAYGDYELETQGGKQSLEDVLSSADDQTYDSAEDVHRRILELIGR